MSAPCTNASKGIIFQVKELKQLIATIFFMFVFLLYREDKKTCSQNTIVSLKIPER